jgi:hypothetical protein
MTWLFIEAAAAASAHGKAKEKANIEIKMPHVRVKIAIMLPSPHGIFHFARRDFSALSLRLPQRCTTQAQPATSSRSIGFCCAAKESGMS